MCGIAGKLATTAPGDAQLLARQLDALRHRGPDDEGTFVDGTLALGMTRLAVIDPAGGAQPCFAAAGTVVVVCNGEVYNHRALRTELAAHGTPCPGGSDVAVIGHLYALYGERCFERLRGMFAIALWDARARRLLLVRDRMGKKPLVWARTNDGDVVFGSEPRAVLADPRVDRGLDDAALDAFLVNQYVPPSSSAHRALHHVAPGGLVCVEPGRAPVLRRWWQPPHPRPRRGLTLHAAADELRAWLLDAVAVRLQSDVPLGAFLSGGLDSGAVVAAMAQCSAQPVRTFSARFEQEAFDEGPWARAVARRWGTTHAELEIEPVSADGLERLIHHLAEPLADPAAVPAFALAEAARREVTVALTGDGGDELLAGYRRHHQLCWTRPAGVWPEPLARAPWPTRRAGRLARRLTLEPPARYADLFRHFSDADRRELYGPRLRPRLDADPIAHLREAWERSTGTWTDRLGAVDRETYLAADLLPKADLTSMAHGLELRSPLLDHELLEWSATIPPWLKRRGATGKRVLREAARPWLGDEVALRPKQGFAVPVSDWLRGPLRELAADILLSRRAADRGLLERSAIERVLSDHCAGADRGAVLWSALTLELWCRAHADPAGEPRRRPLAGAVG